MPLYASQPGDAGLVDASRLHAAEQRVDVRHDPAARAVGTWGELLSERRLVVRAFRFATLSWVRRIRRTDVACGVRRRRLGWTQRRYRRWQPRCSAAGARSKWRECCVRVAPKGMALRPLPPGPCVALLTSTWASSTPRFASPHPRIVRACPRTRERKLELLQQLKVMGDPRVEVKRCLIVQG
jgi:hypothetical protein